MKILLLGVGMQGKAALRDLVHNEQVTAIIAADRDLAGLKAHVTSRQYGARVQCTHIDAADIESLNRLMGQGPDVMIDLLPVPFAGNVATAAVNHRVHLVNTHYLVPEIRALAEQAKTQDVTILPEFGMDPGLDLVLLGEAVRALDRVEEIASYGAGFPEPEAADNALKYKASWTFEGVLKSYRRAGRIIRDGKVVDIKETEMFSPENVHYLELDALGWLEAIPNGDALKYADLLGIDRSALRNMGRYTLRWPGHCKFWKKLVDLRLLDDEPVEVNGVAVDRKRFLAAAIEPQIQYRSAERDVVVVRIEVTGRKNGRKRRVVYQLIDRRDLETGLMAMNRTVGFTASIGAVLIGTGQISQRGLLSPVNDIPYDLLVQELAKRKIWVTAELVDSD